MPTAIKRRSYDDLLRPTLQGSLGITFRTVLRVIPSGPLIVPDQTAERSQKISSPVVENREAKPTTAKSKAAPTTLIFQLPGAEETAKPAPKATAVPAQKEEKDGRLIKILSQLSDLEKTLVMSALQKAGDCSEDELREFLGMHPGVRELRLRNSICAIWSEGSWTKSMPVKDKARPVFDRARLIAKELEQNHEAYERLCAHCAIPVLSKDRSDKAKERKLEALMQISELSPIQRAILGNATSDSLLALSNQLTENEDARRNIWRISPNPYTLASIAYKLRFDPAEMRPDEQALIQKIFCKSDILPGEFDKLNFALSNEQTFSKEPLKGICANICRSKDPLIDMAMASAEADVLLDFLDVRRSKIDISIDHSRGVSKACSDTENHPNNDDLYTSIAILIDEGKESTIDAVFDGVGGHAGGSVASSLAKDTLEISALAGWIQSPQDARRILLLANIMILIDKETANLPQMGTTASISYIEEQKFYGIHCGDSPWIVMRADKQVSRARPHAVNNAIFSGLGLSPRSVDVNNMPKVFKPVDLQPGDVVITCTDGISDVLCFHEMLMAVKEAGMDANLAARKIIEMAGSRSDHDQEYPSLCGCKPKKGKDDDQTLIVRFI